MREPCSFCGETHPPGPVGEPGSMFAGIEFKVCPKIPENCFYVDDEYAPGPRGALYVMGSSLGTK